MKSLITFLFLISLLCSIHAQKHVMTSTSNSTSCETSEDNNSYTFKSSSSKDVSIELVKLLTEELGKSSYKNKNRYEWEDEEGLYKFRVQKGKIKIELNKSEMTKRFFRQLKSLAEKCSLIISDGHSSEHNSAYKQLNKKIK